MNDGSAVAAADVADHPLGAEKGAAVSAIALTSGDARAARR